MTFFVKNKNLVNYFEGSNLFTDKSNVEKSFSGYYYSNHLLSQKHEFHLVDPSPWPLVAAMGALSLTVGGVMFMHGYNYGFEIFRNGLLIILFVMFVWWRDIVREGTYEGQHTPGVVSGLKYGMLLFIASEVMFFVAFFWAFFHFQMNPGIFVGDAFPPQGYPVLDPWKIPLLNTIILLTSGATITWAHHSIVYGSKDDAMKALITTIILAIAFTLLQGFEYSTASFSISDGSYGSVFYMLTGFHGFHVLIGTCFILVCTLRLYLNHFTREHHVGFELAAWYWHFVDVVWLFLFITVYWFGS
jgi:heme/copper-type cytochrome/quinol oxidase subunit 3